MTLIAMKSTSRRRIPGLGIARLASNIVHPDGVHDF
jgi:hypothetical protein